MAFFSVVVPTYNRAAMLRQTLLSIEGQTDQDFECLVVDNASTDDTPLVFESYRNDSRFRLFRNPVNQGQQVSRNRAIREARAPWVTFLDSDDLWLPSRLEEFHRAINARPETGFWFSDGFWLEGEQVVGRFFEGRSTIPEGPVPGYYAVGGRYLPYVTTNVCLRREYFARLGYFREDMQILEDTEFYAKVLAAGVPVGAIHRPLSLYRLHAAQMTQKHWIQFKESMMALEAAKAPPEIMAQYREALARDKAVFLLKAGEPAAAREFLLKEGRGGFPVLLALTRIPGVCFRFLRSVSRLWKASRRTFRKSPENRAAEAFFTSLVSGRRTAKSL